MVKFKFEVVNEAPNIIKLILTGSLSEETRLPDLELEPGQVVQIELDGLSHINSYGIMTWFKWVSMFGVNNEVQLINCQKVFIDMVNSVKGVLPPKSTIVSFYVPYYCEDNDENIFVKFNGTEAVPEEWKCEQCPNLAVVDVNLSSYLSFRK